MSKQEQEYKIELGVEALDKLKRLSYEENRTLKKHCLEQERQISNLRGEMDQMDNMADVLLAGYAKMLTTAHYLEPKRRAEILAGIVNHTMSEADTITLCCFIKHFFASIIKSIHAKAPHYKHIRTVRKLHLLRAFDPNLAGLYDEVAAEMGFDNSGRKNSYITQLYCYINELFVSKKWNPHAHPAQQERDPEKMVRDRLREINVRDPALIRSLKSRVVQGVQCKPMREALLVCLAHCAVKFNRQ